MVSAPAFSVPWIFALARKPLTVKLTELPWMVPVNRCVFLDSLSRGTDPATDATVTVPCTLLPEDGSHWMKLTLEPLTAK